MIMMEDREFDGAVEQDPSLAPRSGPFLIDTVAIRNRRKVLKIKSGDEF
jgi:hypothetical protein